MVNRIVYSFNWAMGVGFVDGPVLGGLGSCIHGFFCAAK